MLTTTRFISYHLLQTTIKSYNASELLTIERKKNKAIGKGIQTGPDGYLTFADNNLNNNHTNNLSVTNARRRCRNGGYVVPPKCRGNGKTAGCGMMGGNPVTPLLG